MVGDAYDRAAPVFHRIADPLVYRLLARPLVEAVIDALGPRPGPVLDVAAGTGAFGRALEDVVAVDISVGQLLSNPAARCVRADAEHLPFASNAFAAVGCAFGINHFVRPAEAVGETARVSPIVVVSTWSRPEEEYAPKRIIQAAFERHVGQARSSFGRVLDELSDRVGSVSAVTELLVTAGLDPFVRDVEVEVPWLGWDAFVEYRLAMPSSPNLDARDVLRDKMADAIAVLPDDDLTWRPRVVIGVGRRRSAAAIAAASGDGC
jgi:ubiquinone/menaquinone biosynthesis C-methylase UbiE